MLNTTYYLVGVFTADKFNTGVFDPDIFIQAKLQSGVFTAGGITEWSENKGFRMKGFKLDRYYYIPSQNSHFLGRIHLHEHYSVYYSFFKIKRNLHWLKVSPQNV